MKQEIVDDNQAVKDELPSNLTRNGKEEKNPFMKVIKENAVEYRMQQLFNVNPKTWQEFKDKGILPRTGTYEVFLVKLFNHYRQKNEVALRKVELSAQKGTTRAYGRNADTESGLPKVVEAEKVQKIRLDRAREQEVHLKNLATRNELINKQEQYELVAPLLGNIANILRNAADDSPALQETVDKCFVNLYTLGEKLTAQAQQDSDNYVRHMLETPVDLAAIVENAQLEIG